MRQGIKITILACLIVIAVLAIFLINRKGVLNSPSASALEQCNPLIENGKGGINIVFFSDKSTAEKYADYFLSVPPFDSAEKDFNFYYIDSYEPECELYKGIALLCYSKELVKKAASCPNDYIVVSESKEMSIRSSSYMNVISINTNAPLSVFPHEFGHAFANFAEEYVPGTIPFGSKNCVSDCDKFEAEEGCFQGCSEDSYYRSVESGIMRTLNSNSYGKFDESIILGKIAKENPNSAVTGSAIEGSEDCSDEEYYLVEGIYENNEIKILSKEVESGCLGKSGSGPFNYTIKTSENSILTGDEFNPEFIFTDSQSQGEEVISGETLPSSVNFYLKVPIISNANSLEISLDGVELAELNMNDIGARPCKLS